MGGVAILGAGGFVGSRLLEMAVLSGRSDVVPVVRAFRSVARNAALGVEHRLGDALRPESLERALAGCEAVVNVITGDPAEILRTTKGVHAAAVAAGVRVLVHISSATVYGNIERHDLPDDAPPQLDHWMLYARQKGHAENFLRERMADARLAIVVLRPGLIWGPGSPWVLGPASELRRGTAYLVGGGDGVCNLMYVDNLVRAIESVLANPVPGFYNVADDEVTTWREYYQALADGLGVETAIHAVGGDRYRIGLRDHIEGVQSSAAYKWLKNRISTETRATLKQRLARARERNSDGRRPNPAPIVTRQMWDLQTTAYRLPTAKFRATYGHPDSVAFVSGLNASLSWLRFIGVDERDLVESLNPRAVSAAASAADRSAELTLPAGAEAIARQGSPARWVL
jgi:nucleoside-diphosphate-sugar epimerase